MSENTSFKVDDVVKLKNTILADLPEFWGKVIRIRDHLGPNRFIFTIKLATNQEIDVVAGMIEKVEDTSALNDVNTMFRIINPISLDFIEEHNALKSQEEASIDEPNIDDGEFVIEDEEPYVPDTYG